MYKRQDMENVFEEFTQDYFDNLLKGKKWVKTCMACDAGQEILASVMSINMGHDTMLRSLLIAAPSEVFQLYRSLMLLGLQAVIRSAIPQADGLDPDQESYELN